MQIETIWEIYFFRPYNLNIKNLIEAIIYKLNQFYLFFLLLFVSKIHF